MQEKKNDQETEITDQLGKFQEAILSVIQSKECEFPLAIQACQDLVQKGEQDKIYNILVDSLRDNFEHWHEKLKSVTSDELLNLVSNQSDNLNKYCTVFPTIYASYEQLYKDDPNKILRNVRKLFSDIILSDAQIFQNKVTPSLIKSIINAQKGSEVNLSEMKNIINMYYSFNNSESNQEIYKEFLNELTNQEITFCDSFYEDHFSAPFIEYINETQKQLETIQKVMNTILEPEQSKELLTLFSKKLLQEKENNFLEGNPSKISELFMIENRLPMKFIVDTYNEFGFDLSPVYESCSSFIFDKIIGQANEFPENPDEENKSDQISKLVGNLIDSVTFLSDQYTVFFESEEAREKLEEVILAALNYDRFNIVKNTCDYIDSLIESKFSELDVDATIKKIIRFYLYIAAKARFNYQYEISVIRRYISNREMCQYDLQIIEAIRGIDSTAFTNIEKYQKAFIESNKLSEEFNNSVEQNHEFKFSPLVINYLDFIFDHDDLRIMPQQVRRIINEFELFGDRRFKNEELYPIDVGSAIELTLKFPATKSAYRVTCDFYFATVIVALSNGPQRFEQIVDILNNRQSIATRIVAILYHMNLVLIEKKSNEIPSRLCDESEIYFNPRFRSAKLKIKIPPIIKFKYKYQSNFHGEPITSGIAELLERNGRMKVGDLVRELVVKFHRIEITPEMVLRELPKEYRDETKIIDLETFNRQ